MKLRKQRIAQLIDPITKFYVTFLEPCSLRVLHTILKDAIFDTGFHFHAPSCRQVFQTFLRCEMSFLFKRFLCFSEAFPFHPRSNYLLQLVLALFLTVRHFQLEPTRPVSTRRAAGPQ